VREQDINNFIFIFPSKDNLNMTQKKFHARGFTEGVEETRAARVSFKLYLRELEEKAIDLELFEDDDPLPLDDAGLEDLLDDFISSHDDVMDVAKEKDPIDGTEYVMDQMSIWLQDKGYTSSEVDAWMDQDRVHDFIYNGLT